MTVRPTALVASLAIAAACSSPNMTVLAPVPAVEHRRVDLCASACRDSLELTYLGVSGFVLRRGDHALMTAPSFTNPGALRLLLPSPFRLDPDTAIVDRRLERVALAGVDAILVGHAHYDHLLDVPYIARAWTPGARVYGSATMANTLAGDPKVRARALSIADSAGSATTPGRWIYPEGGRFRFMPVVSSHAPNAWLYTFADGVVQEPRPSLPRTARGWRKGEVYAYVVDAIAPDSTPLFRVYYQDAAADPAFLAIPPMSGSDVRAVDVAILCVGNYEGARGNPDVLLGTLRPRFVVLSHWEDFFRSPLDPLRVIPLTDTERLVQRLRAAVGERWITPEPLSRVTIGF